VRVKTLVVDIDQLANMLAINKQTILKHRAEVRICPRLAGLPAAYQNRPKLLWWAADIEAWADSHRTFRPGAAVEPIPSTPPTTILPMPKKRRPGRPTNAERFGGAA